MELRTSLDLRGIQATRKMYLKGSCRVNIILTQRVADVTDLMIRTMFKVVNVDVWVTVGATDMSEMGTSSEIMETNVVLMGQVFMTALGILIILTSSVSGMQVDTVVATTGID